MPEPGANTIAEILSEPAIWKSCLEELESSGDLESFNRKLSSDLEWVFIGCGSSYYLAQVASATWSIVTGRKSRAIPASEITLFPQSLPLPCQPVLITRSGHTSEVLQAADYLEKELHTRTLAITCASATPIEKKTTYVIKLLPADEKSTVMTRSFTSMLITLQLLAAMRAERADFVEGLRDLSAQFAPRFVSIRGTIKTLVDSNSFADYVFLGQGPFFGIAQESMLKVKEMSCSYAQCFHTLEFRHGPKAIVSPQTLITFIISETGFDAELAVLEEIKKLGGTTLVVSNADDPIIRRCADYAVELSLKIPEAARAAASVVPGQLLGFYTGIKKGLNPDEPRNLSRVVLLENSK
jgi:glutamine---fructose-6-phosphate transaminase (isomerizing)